MSTFSACHVRGLRWIASGLFPIILSAAPPDAQAIEVGWELLEDGGFEYTIQIPSRYIQ